MAKNPQIPVTTPTPVPVYVKPTEAYSALLGVLRWANLEADQLSPENKRAFRSRARTLLLVLGAGNVSD